MSKQPEMVIARNPRATRNNDTTLNLDNQMYQQPVTSFQRVSNDAPLSEETKTAIQTQCCNSMSTASRRRKPRALPPAMSVFPKKISWTARATVSAIRSGFWKSIAGITAIPPSATTTRTTDIREPTSTGPDSSGCLPTSRRARSSALSLRI